MAERGAGKGAQECNRIAVHSFEAGLGHVKEDRNLAIGVLPSYPCVVFKLSKQKKERETRKKGYGVLLQANPVGGGGDNSPGR